VDKVFGRGTTPREVASYLVHAVVPAREAAPVDPGREAAPVDPARGAAPVDPARGAVA
jgi:hypothetical protein